MKKISLVLLLFTAYCLPHTAYCYAANYFVSPTGTNSGTGPISAPWKTVQYAVDHVAPGDTIYLRTGTYAESVKVTLSGTPSQPISLTSFNNEIVTIDGGSNRALWPYTAVPQYWIIDGLRFVSLNTHTIEFSSWGCDGTCSGINHWIIRNNYVSGPIQIYGAYNLIQNNEVSGLINNGNGNGIQDQFDVSHHNIFRGNTVHDFSHRAIWTMHRTHDDLIENNIVYNFGGQCIDTDGYGTVEWNHIVRGNLITNCGESGIEMENTFNSLVENNVINGAHDHGMNIINYGCDIPAVGSCYTPDSQCQADPTNTWGDTNGFSDGKSDCEGKDTQNIVRQNLIYNTGTNGGFISYHAGGIKFQGNTVVGQAGSKWGVRLDDATYCPNFEMQSNIFIGHSESEIYVGDYSSITVDDHNLFFNTNPNYIYKVSDGQTFWRNQSLAQYQTSTGKGQGSLTGDPQFVNPSNGNFHLMASSPAIGHGLIIGIPTDLDGNVRQSPPTIGAYEYFSPPDYLKFQNFLLHFTNIFDFNKLIGQIFQ